MPSRTLFSPEPVYACEPEPLRRYDSLATFNASWRAARLA
jgi:hypothetical protein